MNSITTNTLDQDTSISYNASNARPALADLALRKSPLLSRKELRDLIIDQLG